MPNAKIKLSMSKPVRRASSKRLGGFQYAGTKIGSVRPRRRVAKLVRYIIRRYPGLTR
jgi:hypothetical protein